VPPGQSGMDTLTAPDHAALAYDAMAPFYDDFTAHHDYEGWIAILERFALEHGLRGRRVLDVACGTGKSTAPFVARGYVVTACDGSAGMLTHARARLGAGVPLHRRDLRALGSLGAFDLVCCIDDGLNYLLEEDELVAALRGMVARLDRGGLVLFDLNTLATYRGFFAGPVVVETRSHVLVWQGRASADFADGEIAEATFDAFALDGAAPPVRAVHAQRHYTPEAVDRALEEAGLELVARRGQDLAGVLSRELDESRDTKVIHLAQCRQ
jgi:SAM-dependent methyltransferase